MNKLTEEVSQENKFFRSPDIIIFCAFLSYFAAYWYCDSVLFTDLYLNWRFCALVIVLTGIPLILNYHHRTNPEAYIWLICFILCCISAFFSLSTVWNEAQMILFIHIFYIWWVLTRNGKLLDGKSGHLLPIDAFNGFIKIPFSNFFTRAYTISRLIIGNHSDKKQKFQKIWLLLAIIPSILLFIIVISLLMRTDGNFSSLITRLFKFISFDIDENTIIVFVFSIPVGAWLFGLITGAANNSRTKINQQRDCTILFLNEIKKIPHAFWTIIVCLFSAVYFIFFFLQGTYLFGAFTRTLPSGFIVSEYARQGFFELCKIVTVNFTLLWLVTRTAVYTSKKNRLFLITCTVLLIECILFAVIALSKLMLYISCFGFTSLRLQSVWLISILITACILWIYTLYTGKSVFRKWMIFGVSTLTILSFI